MTVFHLILAKYFGLVTETIAFLAAKQGFFIMDFVICSILGLGTSPILPSITSRENVLEESVAVKTPSYQDAITLECFAH